MSGGHATPRWRLARVITRLNIGGPSIQAITLSRDLVAAGIDTCLVHGRLGEGEGDMRTLLPIETVREEYLDDLQRPVSPWHDLRAGWRLFRLFCRWRPHLVHTHMAKAGALGRLAAVIFNRTVGRSAPARLVHTYHGHVFEGYFGSPSTRVFLAVERWLARRTDVLIAISPQIRHDLIETYRITAADRVRLVSLGFDLQRLLAIDDDARRRARQQLGLAPSALVVTTVGRLTAIKCHTLFVAAAAAVTRRHPDACFLIVGDGELRQPLEREVASAGLGDAVRFLGWRGDLDVIYGATDVFLLTSRNEGTPVALIEAMAAGVASVSTDVGGVRDVINTPLVGTRVPFDDLDGLVAALDNYLSSSELRRTTGAQARHSVALRFSLTRLLVDIEQVYRQLLATD